MPCRLDVRSFGCHDLVVSVPHTAVDDVPVSRVRQLLRAQFPQWAQLALTPVDSAGTANAMYRLGADLVVRLPRFAGAAADVEKERRWLPYLAPRLPVAVPVPLGAGLPAEGHPWPWAVYRWLDGEPPVAGRIAAPVALAHDVAGFAAALRRIDPEGAPDAYRGEPLAMRDPATRETLASLGAAVDRRAVEAVWQEALRAPAWPGRPVWTHGDLQPGNMLIGDGRLSAVIDFGCTGLGDPAVDLIVAWYVLPAQVRGVFRAAVGAGDADWARGRGWALSIALAELASYRDTNPRMAGIARHVIAEVLSDVT